MTALADVACEKINKKRNETSTVACTAHLQQANTSTVLVSSYTVVLVGKFSTVCTWQSPYRTKTYGQYSPDGARLSDL